MMWSVLFNTFLFIFGIIIGVGIMITEAIDKGFMVKSKTENKYIWIKEIKSKKKGDN